MLEVAVRLRVKRLIGQLPNDVDKHSTSFVRDQRRRDDSGVEAVRSRGS